MRAHDLQSDKKQNQSQASFKLEEQLANVVSIESCPIPEHLQSSEIIQNISAAYKNKLLTKFKWNQQFRTTLDVQVIEGNFEFMRVKLHYGNYELEIQVIYTEIEEKMIEKDNSKSGSFGVVRFVAFEDNNYAVKGVKYELKEGGDIDAEEAYKQYFLYVVADVLEVGPKVLPLFGYDILFTKSTVFFAMEQCEPTKLQQIENIEAELLKNLQIMHSRSFTHFDIKPDNIAFSSLLKKHIFIDFGLSKIIKQPPGQKTKTKFQGTLSYCSDQMKKCYLLGRTCFVDLYQNDLCCLKKTKKALENLLKVNNFLKLTNSEENRQVQKFNIFQKIISVLQLKYNLHIMNLKEVLNILENKPKRRRVLYEILNYSSIPLAKAEDQETIKKISLIKEQIFKKYFKADPVDTFLCDCFNQAQRTHSLEEIIPISQILQSKPQFFYQYLTEPDLILKLFHFFQPFVYQNPNFISQNQFNLRKTLVNKIYEIQQPSYKKPVLLLQQMQLSLAFFYKKFKDFKNVEILDQIRVTFASSPDWKFMWEIQDEIISLIQCPFLKMLRILEFYLYALLIQQFQDDTSFNRVLRFKEKIPQNLNSFRQIKAKSFFLSIQKNSQFFQFSLEQKKQMLNQINRIGSDCVTAAEKESNQSIKRIFIELCLTVRGNFQKYNPQDQEESAFISSLAKNQQELKQRQSGNLPKRMIQKLTLRQKQTQLSSKKIIPQQGRDSSQLNGILISEILQRFYKEIKKKQITDNELYAMFVNLNWCVECACKSMFKSQDEEQITRSNRMKSIDKIQQFLNWSAEGQKAKLIIAQNVLIQIHFRIFHIKFSLLRGKTSQDQQKQIQAVFNLLKPLNFKRPQLVLPLFSLNKYIYPQFIQNRPHFYKEILLSIAEQFVAKKEFSIFQNERLIFKDLVLIRNEKGKESENLEMILSLMKDYQGSIKVDDSKLPLEVFLQGVKYFLMNLALDKLVNIYDKIKYNKQQFKQGLYGYFVFLIYQKAKTYLDLAEQLRQVVRTTLCLKYMFPVCQTKVKPALFNVSRALVNFQSKRKSFIFQRLQMKVAGKNKIEVIAEEIRNKIDKIKKRYENVYMKLDAKVSNFKRI